MLTQAQAKLVEDNHNLIYGMIHKHNLSIEEFYDVLAIGLCKASSSFKPDSEVAFSTYAYTVMYNEVKLEYRRRTKATSIPIEKLASYESLIDVNDNKNNFLDAGVGSVGITPEDIAVSNMHVSTCIDKLRGRDKQIVCLLDKGFTQQEIGSTLGVSQTTVFRAKDKFKKLLSED